LEKELSTITKAEWIAFDWFDSSEFGSNDDRIMSRGKRRTPDEAMQAKINWEETEDEFNEATGIVPEEGDGG